MSDQFVKLDRRFAQYSDEILSENFLLQSYSNGFYPQSNLTWDDLLQNRITVVLGEPGTGKTTEFRSMVDFLKKEKNFAFFIRLDSLINKELQSVLTEDDTQLFNHWLRSNHTATFFLDSIDESKLLRQSDFEEALLNFRNGVTSLGLQRSRIILSSRVSEWKAKTDKDRVLQSLNIPLKDPNGTPEGNEFQVVHLLPLDQEMIKRLLIGKGFHDVTQIIETFDKCFLWKFARRPVDALRYANSISKKKDFNNLTKLIEFDIQERLRETSEREQNDPLSTKQVIEGAETLAAAGVLTRRASILVRDVDSEISETSFDPGKCLPKSWEPNHVRSLLGRALFDPASRGVIRFHDPRVRDFLAAKWLQNRVKQGCPLTRVKHLLFTELPNGLVIREGMQSVIAWIACGTTHLSKEARSWVLKASPELFFSHGDPGLLSVGFRRKILKAYIDRYATRQQTWTKTELESLARFSDASLAEVLNQIAEDPTVDEDSRILAISIARYGRIAEGMEMAQTLAVDETQSLYIRMAAAAALREVAEIDRRRSFAQSAAKLPDIPDKLIGLFIAAIHPDVVGADEVASLVQKTVGNAEELMYRGSWIFDHFKRTLNESQAIDLLTELLPLAVTPPLVTLNNKDTHLSTKYKWVGQWFPELLNKAIKKKGLSDSDAKTIARAWAWLEELGVCTNRYVSLPDEFEIESRQQTVVRRQYFWLKYHEYKEAQTRELFSPSQFLGFRGYGGFDVTLEDLTWLLKDVSEQKEFSKQKIALLTCIDIYLKSGKSRSTLNRIKQAVAQSDPLKELLRVEIRQSRYSYVKRIWIEVIRYKFGNKFWWEEQRLKLKHWKRKKRFQIHIFRNLSNLRKGRSVGMLASLVDEAVGENGGFQIAPNTWDELRRKRGTWITKAVSTGCRQVWNEYTPMLPCEKQFPKTTTAGDHAGLAGLSTGVHSGEIDLSKLSQIEIEKAVRYAIVELNGFPNWFEKLVALHPEIVRRVLLNAIEGEWNWPSEHAICGVLQKVRWSDESIRNLLTKSLVDRLDKSFPKKYEILQTVLQCLVDASDEVLRELSITCSKALDACNQIDPSFTDLFVIEIQLNPEKGISRLETFSSSCNQDVDAAVEIIATLSGESIDSRTRLFQPSPPFSAPQLKKLLLVCNRLVKPSDDLERTGPYSSTPRDYAQRYRDSLIHQIADVEKDRNLSVLRSLLHETELEHHKDYILERISRRMRSDNRLGIWTEENIVDFAENFEKDPRTCEDLYLILCDRLNDIKYQVELSDNSIRDEVRLDHDEKALCRWIARKLHDQARGRYIAPLEVEIDQGKRPDIRPENADIPPVPFEVKWAERWSYNQLVESLNKQLVGQYLRAHENRYGIFLLGYIDEDEKKRWYDKGSSRLCFRKLIENLQSKANQLVEQNPNIYAIKVIGIDFRPPS
ncbi:Hypothetical protein PBC10988_3290 [Planctomycetales bacterium 10988]|nr:Hypothetical protein PBC10988_3290 [Planctomycetales bacterium 10988]